MNSLLTSPGQGSIRFFGCITLHVYMLNLNHSHTIRLSCCYSLSYLIIIFCHYCIDMYKQMSICHTLWSCLWSSCCGTKINFPLLYDFINTVLFSPICLWITSLICLLVGGREVVLWVLRCGRWSLFAFCGVCGGREMRDVLRILRGLWRSLSHFFLLLVHLDSCLFSSVSD